MKIMIQQALKLILVLLISTAVSGTLQGQVLDYQNRLSVVLDDGTSVILYGKASSARMTGNVNVSNQYNFRSQNSRIGKHGAINNVYSSIPAITYTDDYYYTSEYYYLPTNLRLSKREDGTPEFLFTKYTTNDRPSEGGSQGALMHFLMEWGLTPAQQADLQQKLEEKFSLMKRGNPKFRSTAKPVAVGPVRLISEAGSFSITSATLNKDNPTARLVHEGKAPSLPGQKVATAAMMDKNSAQLLASTFEESRSITDVSVNCYFQYKVLMPAVKGRVTIDWAKLEEEFMKDTRQKTSQQGVVRKGRDTPGVVHLYDTKQLMDNLLSTKVVDFQLDNYSDQDDPIAQNLIQAFTQAFIESLATQENISTSNKDNKYKREDAPETDNYYIDVERLKVKIERGKEVINLNYRSAITEEVGITGNLASWYDGVRDNEKCVNTVLLDDPFFEFRDINFVLDLEAEEMFGKEVNYVSVDVRKRRSAGNDFQDAITIDRTWLQEHGTLANMTYSRGDDNDSDVYEYKMQWSLKGGKVFPESSRWIKGNWQGVTLAAPIAPRTIEFEADLDDLKAKGIRRATLQVRYQKFGKEFETNIPLTVSKGEPLVEKMIFLDRDKPAYAYRLVLTHEKNGKMAQPEWEAKFNDDYVFASVPELQGPRLEKWVKTASELLAGGGSKDKEITNPTMRILNKVLKAASSLLEEESGK